MFKRYLGDREFNRWVFRLTIPIIIQNAITNFVSMLDNIMVGQVGTLPMSGVSIVNQLIFVFNLCIFGASSGAGIFTAQFYGSRDHDGIRYTFRFKMISCLLLTAIGTSLFAMGSDALIGLYLQGEGDPQDAALALQYGRQYLQVVLWGLLPFALCNTYASTLRETGETTIPMVGGVAAVFVNLVLNYVLIFGHFGAPQMGVRGAALATVISRYVELAIIAGWTHLNPQKNPFIRKAYRSFYIPGKLLGEICKKGAPLLLNEFLWSSGTAFINQCYSTCGLAVVPAQNIASALNNLTSVAFFSMGNAVAIIMGQMLGADRPREEVRLANRRLFAISVVLGVSFSLVSFVFSGAFPKLYNTTEEVARLATQFICIHAAMMPFFAYTHATYFTLRSGGQAFITFVFDSCFMWVVCVPLAFCLSRFTPLAIIPLYILCQLPEFVKMVIGTWFIKKETWIQNLTTANRKSSLA